jgi:hypothetical protein
LRTSPRELARRVGGRLDDTEAWIAYVRVVAVPFVLLEVAIERGNYPPGHEAWAWALAVTFAVGAVALFAAWGLRIAAGAVGAVALVFDTAVVSGYAVLYGFEPNSPVRHLLLLVVVEAALRYGKRGAAWAVASAPALAVFEWRAADRLDVPFDPGHVIFPIALQILVGLIVGSLTARAARGASPSREHPPSS